MYESNAKVVSGVRFEVESRGHKLICDQPGENGGADLGMTPPELFLGSIATCAAFYAVQYLKFRNLPQSGLHVRVTAEKAAQPARLDSIRIEVEAPAAEDERHHTGLVRAVEKCLIHNTLLHTPTIQIAVQPVSAAV